MVSALLTAAALALPLANALPGHPTKEGRLDTREGKIVGGEAAAAGEFPSIVSITNTAVEGLNYCGGTLINDTTVITAGHCSADPASYYRVRAGTLTWAEGGKVSEVEEIIRHPKYEDLPANYAIYDIAIWKLKTPIEASDSISYAKLPKAGTDPAAGNPVTVAGWGALGSGMDGPEELMKVTVPIVDRAKCAEMYAPNEIPSYMICAAPEEGGKDSCQGDSGGPLFDEDDTLVGVVSWGNGCAQAKYPGVYANVADLLDFVNAHIGA